MLNAEDKEKIRDDVRNYFIEINKNTIPKKISDCVKKGFTENEARCMVTQIVKNVSELFY